MRCEWCGWIGTEDDLDFNEHDVPMYCPECGHHVFDDMEFSELCKQFEKIHPNYEAWFDELEAHPNYYPVVITDKHILQIPARYVFERGSDFKDWMDCVVLD